MFVLVFIKWDSVTAESILVSITNMTVLSLLRTEFKFATEKKQLNLNETLGINSHLTNIFTGNVMPLALS